MVQPGFQIRQPAGITRSWRSRPARRLQQPTNHGTYRLAARARPVRVSLGGATLVGRAESDAPAVLSASAKTARSVVPLPQAPHDERPDQDTETDPECHRPPGGAFLGHKEKRAHHRAQHAAKIEASKDGMIT